MQTHMGLDARAFDQARVYGNVTVRPLTASDRAAWDRLWKGYLDFYETTLPKSQYDLTFGRYLDEQGLRGPLPLSISLAWATTTTSTDPHNPARRLAGVRGFLRYLGNR